MPRSTQGVLAVLGLALALAAEEAPPGFAWTAAESKRLVKLEKEVRPIEAGTLFEHASKAWVVQSDISTRFSAELALYVEQAGQAFDEVLPGKDQVHVAPTVLATASLEKFRTLTTSTQRSYFIWKLDSTKQWERFHVYLRTERDEERDFRNFDHEHIKASLGEAVLQKHIGDAKSTPPWLRHGAMAWFRTYDPRKSQAENKATRVSSVEVGRRLAAGGWTVESAPPLAWLLGLAEEAWSGDQWDRHEAIALSFFDFLLGSRAGQEILENAFEAIRALRTDVIPAEKLQALEKSWHDQIARDLDATKPRSPPGAR